MELYDFIKQYNYKNVSDAALLKQREKLNEDIFKELNKNSLIDFYKLFKKEAKDYKGYILTNIDGCDCEISNTPPAKKRYKSISGNNDIKVSRIKLSNLLFENILEHIMSIRKVDIMKKILYIKINIL